MKPTIYAAALVASACVMTPWSAPLAADQTVPGAGNAQAEALAKSSPLVQSALARLQHDLATVQDRQLREVTYDAVFNPDTCIYHRSELTAATKQSILATLQAAGLYSATDAAAFPGGALAGVFPAVLNDKSQCPHLPQHFGSTPGSSFGSHHSYPGGLPIHESMNLSSALSLAENYTYVYGGTGPDGLPRIPASRSPRVIGQGISSDEIIAAPMWHDWAKSFVFQWNADGTEFAEFNFGGSGVTDNNGQPGDSRTGGHHILSLAETIARELPATFIIAQASAHSAPTLGNEYKVVNWLRAAAIVAQADPYARGLLTKDAAGNPRLPATNAGRHVDLNAAGQTNVRIEDTIHNLSDADFVFSIPAVSETQVILQALASRYGYDPTDVARYNTKYRNPSLSFLSGERLLVLYTNQGLDAVAAELDVLRAKGII